MSFHSATTAKNVDGIGVDAVLNLSLDRRSSKTGSRMGHRRTESHVSRVSQVSSRKPINSRLKFFLQLFF